jgi:hypothetical protein
MNNKREKMNIFKSAIVVLLLAFSSVYADGFGINLGPFSLQIGGYGGDYISVHRNLLDQPICSAIANQNRLDIVIEGVDIVNSKEKKVVRKRIVIEPYVFGVTNEGKPILNGNIVEEKLIKEVTVKFGDAHFDEPTTSDPADKGSLFGQLSNDKNQNIDIRKVVGIKVLDDWHFDAPKDYKGLNDDNITVICQIPVLKQ